MSKVDLILEELKALNAQNRLWSTAEVGMYFGVSAKSACGIVCKSGFPTPIKVPGIGRRWEPEEVKKWAKRYQGRNLRRVS